jgi:uncharacterized membrane protein YphA (DoxX/SURF4 family)
MKGKIIFTLRLLVAGILLQTLYFKFTGAPESVYIFSTLGVEPFGRIFAGVSELIASVLILIPPTQVLGAGMAVGIMLGAILSHLFILGINVQGDGGELFGLACAVFLLSLVILYCRQEQIKAWTQKIKMLLAKSKA